MQLAELILLVMWTIAGMTIAIGCITLHPKWYVASLLGFEKRWEKLAVSIVLLTFVIVRVYQWQSSLNPSIIWSL